MDLITLALAKKFTTDSLAGLGTLKGEDGDSAYEIAVENGFAGTEAEWLESLKGEEGNSGVYLGEEEPLDINTKVWIKPDGNANDGSGGSSEGGISVETLTHILKNYVTTEDYTASLKLKEDIENKVTSFELNFIDADNKKYPTIIALIDYLNKYYYNNSNIDEMIKSMQIDEEGYLTVTLPLLRDGETSGETLVIGKVSGKDGIDGQDGADGIGISNVVINSDGELVLTYTNGESTNLGKVVGADGTNGTDGKDGTNGTNGVGIKTVTLSTDGELSILLTDNTVCNLGNIKGEKGDKGEQGIQGPKGDKGEQGEQGIGIISSEIDTNGELVLTYSDGSTANVGAVIGAKGDTPVKGIDYWTNADKAEIMGDQATPLFANDISECTDTSRVYLLPDGFLYAYIKTIIEKTAYTNQLPISTDNKGKVYNRVGYASGRYNSSSTAFGSLKTEEGYYTTGLIPFKMGQTLRIKGAEISELPILETKDIYPSFAFIGSSRTTFIGGRYFNWTQHLGMVMDSKSEYYFVKSATVSNDICTFVTDKNTGSSISADDVYYISLSLKVTDPSAVIITVDEEITDEFIEEYDYNWANTGRAYAPADYEDRIVALESKLANFGTDMIYGIVDEDNAILMGGTLEAGTYTLKYQNADGTATEIGTFEVV